MPRFALPAISFVAMVIALGGFFLLHNALPRRLDLALAAPESVELVSLEPADASGEPDIPLQEYVTLGFTKLTPADARTATAEIRTSVPAWRKYVPGLKCAFSPRHALRFRSKGHLYEVLVCYECGEVVSFEDGKLIGDSELVGSRETLDGLLAAAHVPISHTD